jgi:hypothetical protein
MKVPTKERIEQVGTNRFRGYFILGGIQLDYEVTYELPLPDLTKLLVQKPDLAQSYGLIEITKSGVIIELADYEHLFFQSFIHNLFAVFLTGALIRHDEERVLWCEDRKVELETHVSVGMVGHGFREFSPEICQMLSAPKYGCRF